METKRLIKLIEIKDVVLRFLENKDFIEDIKQLCDYHLQCDARKKDKAPLIFTLKLDFFEIKTEDLLNFVTKETDSFLQTVQEIAHFLVKSYFQQQNSLNNLDINLDDIICNFRIYNLPLHQYKFSLRGAHIDCTLSTFICTVQKTNPVVKYIRQSSWKCLNCFNSPLVSIRNRVATHKPPKCKRCLKPCIEQLEYRVTSDYCAAQVYESEHLSQLRDCFSINTLEIRLFDDLCQELKIGQEYTVVGIYEVVNKFYNVFSLSET